ncbi:MAG TPA: sigma 54-interacting transcriptional regulator [Geobacteraceae bacterium]|nr:sigma 54-interacting transcriptional regulator [Geobacteraceae bacterium]
MKTRKPMTDEEREFFATVAAAAFANPFSRERNEFDRQIAGMERGDVGREEMVQRVTVRVAERLARLEREGRADLRLYDEAEQRTVGVAFLFNVYHRFRNDLDSFIPVQLRAGDTPCRVPFAREALAMLSRLGFAEEEAWKYFAIFYQLRRAFFFIESSLVGVSPSMHTLRLHLWNNVFTCNIGLFDTHLWKRMEDFSTLLLGETGTGKGAAAAAIGRSCFIPFDPAKGCFVESFTRNFIPLNLSQYPETLIESELFGHRKGAFTGAVGHHEGVFSRCTPHGSIFLDEIGDLSVPVQIKLLQVLQERTFSPVGSHERLRFHGRVIAATNRPLGEMRRRGQFRDDFYYRLCSDIITVPPLRQRVHENPRELDVMVGHLLARMVGETRRELVEMVLDILRRDLPPDYPWPGNVRELEQAVRRILLTRSYQGDLAADDGVDFGAAAVAERTVDAQTLLATYCRRLYERYGTYEEVARRLRLDRRTVKKYLQGEGKGTEAPGPG